MENRLRSLRESKNMTQAELAGKSGLSLRTIQRIEAGSILKGYTLNTLAKTLDTEPENLLPDNPGKDIARAKKINRSALFGLVLPYGNIIFPLILTYKTNDELNKELGQQIVSVQILLSAILSVTMIISPFIQKALLITFPLFLIPLITLIVIKLYIIIRNGMSLNQQKNLYFRLRINFI